MKEQVSWAYLYKMAENPLWPRAHRYTGWIGTWAIRTQTFAIDLLNFFTQIYIIVTYISYQSPIWVVYKNVLNFVLVAMATKHGGWVAKHFNNNWDDQKHKQTGTKHDWCMKDAGQFWVKLYGRVAMTTVNNEMK